MAHVTDPFVYIAYISDDSSTYNVKMHASIATAIGATPVARSANPLWKRPHKDLRMAYGKNQAAPLNRIEAICQNPAEDLFIGNVASFDWNDGATYDVEGIKGEKRLRRG